MFVHKMPRKILSLIFQILVKSIVLIECCQQHFCSVQCLTMSTISYPFFKMFSLCVCLRFKLLIYYMLKYSVKICFHNPKNLFHNLENSCSKNMCKGNVVNKSAHELCSHNHRCSMLIVNAVHTKCMWDIHLENDLINKSRAKNLTKKTQNSIFDGVK